MSNLNPLTHHIAIPFGANILGLLSFFVALGGVFLPLNFAERLPRNVPSQVMLLPGLLTLAAVVAFDFWWRMRQPESERWSKLLYPTYGGCFFFVPIWLFFPGVVLGTLTLGIVITIVNRLA